MKTLTEKYQALVEGNFSKHQFLRDAKMQYPNFITQFNGVDDAISILKSKGLIFESEQVEETPEEVEETHNTGDYSDYIVFHDDTFYIDSIDVESGEAIVEPGDEITFSYEGREFSARVSDRAVGRDDEAYELDLLGNAAQALNENAEEVEVDVLDTIPLNQVHKGIRYELKKKGFKTSRVSIEDWEKAKEKVRKNFEKDPNYYIHKLADVKPKKDDKRADTMKEVPKDGKDKHNQMEKVPLKEQILRKYIKRKIIKTLSEDRKTTKDTVQESLLREVRGNLKEISPGQKKIAYTAAREAIDNIHFPDEVVDNEKVAIAFFENFRSLFYELMADWFSSAGSAPDEY